jgi:hypothetical protein
VWKKKVAVVYIPVVYIYNVYNSNYGDPGWVGWAIYSEGI